MKRWLAVLAVVLAGCSGQGERLVVAAGTTLVDSGFMDAIVDRYEESTGGQVAVVGESSARVVELGRQREAGVLVTHEPMALQRFVADGLAAATAQVILSRFVLVGPQDLASGLDGLTAPEAFEEIAANSWTFVGRGDASGTSTAELAIWAEVGRDPTGEAWYSVTGQGMGPTLQVADQRNAFTLTDRGTWEETASRLSSSPVNLVDSDFLTNSYAVTVVTDDDIEQSQKFFDWLTGGEGSGAITEASRALFGSEIYRPFSVGANG